MVMVGNSWYAIKTEISFLYLLQPSLNRQIILTNAAQHLVRTVEHVLIDTMITCVCVLMAILEKTVIQVGKTIKSGLVKAWFSLATQAQAQA